MDELGPDIVLAEYAASLDGTAAAERPTVLEFDEVRDYAWVHVDDRPAGILQRTLRENALTIPPGRELRLLVEETGRVNYDTKIGEPKGLIGEPRVDGTPIPGPWRVRTFDVAALGQAVTDAAASAIATGRATGPIGLRASFALDEPADLFLDTRGWGKGYAWVNGFFLGRYWRRGPQRTLFVPGTGHPRGRERRRDRRVRGLDRCDRAVPRPTRSGARGRVRAFSARCRAMRRRCANGRTDFGNLILRMALRLPIAHDGQPPVLSRTMSRVGTRSVFGEPPSIAPMSASTARSPSSSNS